MPISEVTACMLDRPRHAALIEDLRSTGCAVKLISDGDIAGIIHAMNTEDTGIDIYIGSGGAPEGVLAAAALRCIGGQMQGRLMLDTEEKRERARRMGITDPNRKYKTDRARLGRRAVRRDRRHRRLPARGRPLSQRAHPNLDGRHALLEPDSAVDHHRAPALKRKRATRGPPA